MFCFVVCQKACFLVSHYLFMSHEQIGWFACDEVQKACELLNGLGLILRLEKGQNEGQTC